jgi:amino acid transporter
MEAHSEAASGSLTITSTAGRLAPNALSVFGVLFCIVTGCAPMAAMQFNVPVTVSGAGAASPASYLVAMIVLTIWSVGYVEMAKRVTAAGGFYTFIAHAFGRIVGLGAAIAVTFMYLIFTPAVVGVTAYFSSGLASAWFSVNIHAWVFSIIIIATVAVLAFFHIELTSKILGVFLITEVLGLFVFDFAVLFQGGRHGLMPNTLNPAFLYDNANGAKAVFGTLAVGIAMFGAFWSWTGFEMAPNYAEESRNPKKLIGPATYFAVIGVGVIYTFTAWMFVAGWGNTNHPNSPNYQNWSVSQGVLNQYTGKLPHGYFSAFYPITDEFVGHLMTNVFQLLMVTGSFACVMAFFATSSRYLFSMGRERLIPSVFGKTHPKHHSPYIANIFTATFVYLVFFGFLYHDSSTLASLTQLGTWPPLLGVFGLLLIMALCSLGTIKYFIVDLKGDERGGPTWPLRTIVAPIIGGGGCVVAAYLLQHNRTFLAGGNNLFIKLFPWVVVGFFVAGVLLALYYRSADRERYDAVGRYLHSEL